MSKSNNQHKERYETLTMEYPEPVSIDTISVDANGNVNTYSNGIEIRPVDVHYEKGYEGERKNRRTVSYGTEKMNVNIYSILGDYDYLIGLDTNSVGNESFSVGMIYRMQISLDRYERFATTGISISV